MWTLLAASRQEIRLSGQVRLTVIRGYLGHAEGVRYVQISNA